MKNFEKYKTSDERGLAFEKWCDSNHEHGGAGSCVRDSNCHACHFEWLDMEYEEKTLPCPFCGGEVKFDQMLGGDSVRCKCGYCAPFSDSESEAIAAHNRVARAVMEAEKEGVEE